MIMRMRYALTPCLFGVFKTYDMHTHTHTNIAHTHMNMRVGAMACMHNTEHACTNKKNTFVIASQLAYSRCKEMRSFDEARRDGLIVMNQSDCV